MLLVGQGWRKERGWEVTEKQDTELRQRYRLVAHGPNPTLGVPKVITMGGGGI